MDRIIIDELAFEELSKGDIVIIEKEKIIDDTVCIVLNDQEYCKLEELGFYLYENMGRPKISKLRKNMTFYKLGTSEYTLLKEYELKLAGDING